METVRYKARRLMNINTDIRRRVRLLLSDLFVDTERSVEDLEQLGLALKRTGVASSEAENILRTEVAPVCSWSSMVGPWPMFDEAWLTQAIEKRLRRPGVLRPGILLVGRLRREWRIVRAPMDHEERS